MASFRHAVISRALPAAIALCAALLAGATAVADELRPSLLEIRETGPDRYLVSLKRPVREGAPIALGVELPPVCQPVSAIREFADELASLTSVTVACATPLRGQSVQVSGLSVLATDMLVRIEWQDGSTQVEHLTADTNDLRVGERSGFGDIALTYLRFGIEHILAGIDHLLFVLALILLLRGARSTVLAVTSFTVAHSITLGLATLDLVRLAQAPVEAAIALSILFLAVELRRRDRGERSLTAEKPWIVAFAFGLLHGFGFAAALRAAGLPQGDVPAALLFFNLGVEIGQLAFVAAVLVLRELAARLPLPRRSSLVRGLHVAVGVIAGFWTVERVVAFWS